MVCKRTLIDIASSPMYSNSSRCMHDSVVIVVSNGDGY